MKELQIDAHAIILYFTIKIMKKHNCACQIKKQKDCLSENSSEESDVEDDVWAADDELTVADGQANIFQRIKQCFGI